jgi:hypothetical protein
MLANNSIPWHKCYVGVRKFVINKIFLAFQDVVENTDNSDYLVYIAFFRNRDVLRTFVEPHSLAIIRALTNGLTTLDIERYRAGNIPDQTFGSAGTA